MLVYSWKIFLENAIEMVSIIPSNRNFQEPPPLHKFLQNSMETFGDH